MATTKIGAATSRSAIVMICEIAVGGLLLQLLPSAIAEREIVTAVHASYADKKLMLHPSDSVIHINDFRSSLSVSLSEESVRQFLQRTVSEFGIPAVVKRLEPALTSLMNSKGLALFDIVNPEIISHEGYLVVQLDFGFPHHLLVDFLKKTV